MSFEIYVQSFQNGDQAGISRQLVRDAFGTHLKELEPNRGQLHYDFTNSCDVDFDADAADPNLLVGFTVHRPCSDQRLWDSLASILRLGDIVLYFPGCRAPLVARSSVAEHLPSDLFSSLGQPEIVASGSEIHQAILSA